MKIPSRVLLRDINITVLTILFRHSELVPFPNQAVIQLVRRHSKVPLNGWVGPRGEAMLDDAHVVNGRGQIVRQVHLILRPLLTVMSCMVSRDWSSVQACCS